ncbi:MAG: heat-inducible transcriptional repressor HrcA [Gammaproteobacteria bacterium]
MNVRQEKELNERAQHLLKVLVESYIQGGQPVGSRTLARIGGLELSPATIRNVMSDLEELGFVEAPHTSAGRVPTDQGYRLFVDTLLKVKPLTLDVVEQVKGSLTSDLEPAGLVESASGALSVMTELVGLVTVPRPKHSVLRQIEFLTLSDRRVLAILVINQQEVQNRIINLDRDYTPAELQTAANYLNANYAGLDLGAMRLQLLNELDRLREDVNNMMLTAIELGEKAVSDTEEGQDELVMSGETRLMDYDEFFSVDKLRQLLDTFNHKRDLLHIMDRCVRAMGVQIFIGQESGHVGLEECSLVTAPYSVDGQVMGVLGVVGPTRMAYDRVIPVVDVTAKLLGTALQDSRG